VKPSRHQYGGAVDAVGGEVGVEILRRHVIDRERRPHVHAG